MYLCMLCAFCALTERSNGSKILSHHNNIPSTQSRRTTGLFVHRIKKINQLGVKTLGFGAWDKLVP